MTVSPADQRSNQLRNNDFFKIHIKHIPTGERVSFEGFVTTFSDSYNSNWSAQPVYGRMDDLATYQGTTRSIQIGFAVPFDSKDMASHNMKQIQKLIQFMYPLYDSGAMSRQNVLKAAPLLTLKWTNLISSVNNENEELVGYINGGLDYSPDVAEGGFLRPELTQHKAPPPRAGKKAIEERHDIRNYFPKSVSLGFSFTVLHTHLVGWAATGEVEDWDGASEAMIAHLKSVGQKAKKTTTTYSFGGTPDIAKRFPNIYHSPPPPPAPVRQQGEEQLNEDYAAAQETIRNAETALQDRERALYRINDADARLLSGQARDNAARLREVLHGSRPATSTDSLSGDDRGLLDADLSSILGRSSWQTP